MTTAIVALACIAMCPLVMVAMMWTMRRGGNERAEDSGDERRADES